MKTLFDEEEAVDKKWIRWQEIAEAYMASRQSVAAERREIIERTVVQWRRNENAV